MGAIKRKSRNILYRMLSSFFLFLVTVQAVMPSQHSPDALKPVWFWSGDCSQPRVIGVQVLLDGKTIFQSHFHACQMNRADAITERGQKTRASFHFSGGHAFQGSYHTTTSETVEGTIWQAGADPEDILLGVCFTAHGQVLLNTIHITQPGKSTASEIDPGLIIKTYPIK